MKKIYFLFILSIFSLNLYCQIYWEKYPGNPVMVPGSSGEWDKEWIDPGSVIYYDNTYHMWYSGGDEKTDTSRIGHATSPDGITWTKDVNNPVMNLGPNGSWEDRNIFGDCVLLNDSIFHMWYTAGPSRQIGYATSEDGSNWTKYGNNPVLRRGPTGSWDNYDVSWSGVIDSSGVKYKMWYRGGQSSGTGSIGYAESDARLPALWVKSNTIVDATDTVVAEIHKDGIIYIVPEGTSPVNDSISKYKLASVDALANTEINIPLTDFSLGQYTVVAVSNAEFVSPDPFLLRLVDDAKLPVLTLAEDTVKI